MNVLFLNMDLWVTDENHIRIIGSLHEAKKALYFYFNDFNNKKYRNNEIT